MDITFNCGKCGQPLTIDAAGAGVSVQCPKCQAALVVPSAQAEQSPVRQDERLPLPPRKPKRRLGLVLGIVGSMLVFLAILCVVLAPIRRFLSQDTLAVAETRVDVVKQLEAVIRRFAALSPASPDFDSVEFDVEPSPSGSIVSPYIGRVDYVMPAQVSSFCWQPPTSTTIVNCRVHLRAWFAYQDAEWVFKELKPAEDRAWSECKGCPSFNLTKKSQELMEQHRQRWRTATEATTRNPSLRIARRNPHVGDETSVVALFAHSRSYLNKPIVVCGGVSVDNSYKYGYEGSSRTYYSLKFTELTEDLRPTGQLTVYALRTKAEPLVGEIQKGKREGSSGKIVRLKVMVTDRSFWNDEFREMLELTDWQFFKPEQGKWGEWAQQSGGN